MCSVSINKIILSSIKVSSIGLPHTLFSQAGFEILQVPTAVISGVENIVDVSSGAVDLEIVTTNLDSRH